MAEEGLVPCLCHVGAARGDGDTLGPAGSAQEQSLHFTEEVLVLVIVRP